MPELEIIKTRPRKPDWLKVKIPIGENYKKVRYLQATYYL